jgi:hypothetical protein
MQPDVLKTIGVVRTCGEITQPFEAGWATNAPGKIRGGARQSFFLE